MVFYVFLEYVSVSRNHIGFYILLVQSEKESEPLSVVLKPQFGLCAVTARRYRLLRILETYVYQNTYVLYTFPMDPYGAEDYTVMTGPHW